MIDMERAARENAERRAAEGSEALQPTDNLCRLLLPIPGNTNTGRNTGILPVIPHPKSQYRVIAVV